MCAQSSCFVKKYRHIDLWLSNYLSPIHWIMLHSVTTWEDFDRQKPRTWYFVMFHFSKKNISISPSHLQNDMYFPPILSDPTCSLRLIQHFTKQTTFFDHVIFNIFLNWLVRSCLTDAQISHNSKVFIIERFVLWRDVAFILIFQYEL